MFDENIVVEKIQLAEPDKDKVSFCNGCKDVYKPLIRPPSTWRYIVGEYENETYRI